MQATIEIDPVLFEQAEALARKKGQHFSALVQESLLKTLSANRPEAPTVEAYGEPLTDDDIDQSARLTFRALDEDEGRTEAR